MRSLKMKALCLGLLSTAIISSTSAFAATNPVTATKAQVKTQATYSANYGWGTINGYGVRLRSTPSTSSTRNVIRLLNKGDRVDILGTAGDPEGTYFYKVSYEGTEGYVAFNYVDFD